MKIDFGGWPSYLVMVFALIGAWHTGVIGLSIFVAMFVVVFFSRRTAFIKPPRKFVKPVDDADPPLWSEP